MFSAVEKNNKKPLNTSCWSRISPAKVAGTDMDSKASAEEKYLNKENL